MFNKFCQWLDSNRGPLVLEATALPTEPQPLPDVTYLPNKTFCRISQRIFHCPDRKTRMAANADTRAVQEAGLQVRPEPELGVWQRAQLSRIRRAVITSRNSHVRIRNRKTRKREKRVILTILVPLMVSFIYVIVTIRLSMNKTMEIRLTFLAKNTGIEQRIRS